MGVQKSQCRVFPGCQQKWSRFVQINKRLCLQLSSGLWEEFCHLGYVFVQPLGFGFLQRSTTRARARERARTRTRVRAVCARARASGSVGGCVS